MKIPISIIVDDSNHGTCDRYCPFIFDNTCLLFNEELDDTILPADLSWQDGVNPTKQRCYKCSLI